MKKLICMKIENVFFRKYKFVLQEDDKYEC